MDKINNDKVNTLIHKLGLKYKLSDKEIREIVESPFEFSASIIKQLKLDEVSDEDELQNIKSNFMYTGFAKLFISPVGFAKKVRKNKLNLNKWKK